jgi:hypothetical protein
VQQISIEQGLHKPELVWRRAGVRGNVYYRHMPDGTIIRVEPKRPTLSSGSTRHDRSRIVVTAGSDRSDQRSVLIHEMAHVAVGGPEWHGAAFYRVAWRYWGLYAPSISTRTLLKREGAYMTTALKVAQELGLHGAKTALANKRAAMRRPR